MPKRKRDEPPMARVEAPSKKRKTGRRTKTPPSPKEVAVQVDARLKKRWDELSAIVSHAKREGAKAFDELWETVAEIVDHDPPLYVVGGYANDVAYYWEALGEKARTARRLMRVA